MIFVNQNILEIKLDTKYGDLASLADHKILYKGPNTSGEWTPTIEGTKLVYTLVLADKLVRGVYTFQAYSIDGVGREIFGKPVKVVVDSTIE